MSDTTIEIILELFAEEALEFGEPYLEALERGRRALASHDAEVIASHRVEWADYFEEWVSTVGAPPFTPEAVVAALRGPVRWHETEKPVPLMEALIGQLPEAAMIADPFSGSGPTLLASKLLGRRSIGVELLERNCETIARRASQEVFTFGVLA